MAVSIIQYTKILLLYDTKNYDSQHFPRLWDL